MKNFDNIKALILDKDGVFVDFHKLWMRIIAARAQILAEYTTSNWDSFNHVRSTCIRAMGVDDEDETIDPDSPVSMPADMVKTAITTGLYIAVNSLEPTYTWKNAQADVAKSDKDLAEQLDFDDMIIAVDGSIDKIKAIAEAGFKLAIFTSDSAKNTEKTLAKFELNDIVQDTVAGMYKTADMYTGICERLGVKADETIFVTDSPVDARIGKEAGANVLAVFSGVIRKADQEKHAVNVDEFIDSLADLDLSALTQNAAV